MGEHGDRIHRPTAAPPRDGRPLLGLPYERVAHGGEAPAGRRDNHGERDSGRRSSRLLRDAATGRHRAPETRSRASCSARFRRRLVGMRRPASGRLSRRASSVSRAPRTRCGGAGPSGTSPSGTTARTSTTRSTTTESAARHAAGQHRRRADRWPRRQPRVDGEPRPLRHGRVGAGRSGDRPADRHRLAAPLGQLAAVRDAVAVARPLECRRRTAR